MGKNVKGIDPKRLGELNAALELFFFGYRRFTARPDALLRRRGLGRVHHRVLYFIGHNSGISVNGLLAKLGVTKQALNAPLRELIALKLVEAHAGATDRRQKRLHLTPKGLVLEEQLSGGQRQALEAIFKTTGKQAEGHWRAVMKAIAHK